MSLTLVITHALAFAAGMASVWIIAVCAAAGRADDRADAMFEEDRIQYDPLEDGPPEAVHAEDMRRITPHERTAITDDAVAARRRAMDRGN